MDDALRRTTHAVEQYAVPDELIAMAAGSLMQMPAAARAQAEIHALAEGIVLIADEHAGPHESCGMCHAIGNALAVAMGAIRAEADLELRRMYETDQ
jgi:kynureninase